MDEDALERHISAVLQEDPAASTEEIVRYTRAKGPILWVEKPTDFGTRLVPRTCIHDPAAYLRKGVQNCFAGENSPARRHRVRAVQEARAEKDSAGSQQAPEKSQSRDLEPNPWSLVLASLERKINRHSFETWLKPTRFSHTAGPTLFVKVPNRDFCHIGDKYGDLISEAIENLGLEFQDVEFITGGKVA